MKKFGSLISFLLVLSLPVSGPLFAEDRSAAEQTAYEHNRAGMASMSMARFEEAIEEFNKAAVLLQDYHIRNRPLIYTPIFMTGWAYEKLGRLDEACDRFKTFLEISPPDLVEASKAQHAHEVLEKCAD